MHNRKYITVGFRQWRNRKLWRRQVHYHQWLFETYNSNIGGYRLTITDTSLSDVQSHLLPGVPPPGSQIRSKSCGSFFSDQICLILFLQNPPHPPVQQNESTNVFSSDEISLGFYLEQQWGQQNKMSSQ